MIKGIFVTQKERGFIFVVLGGVIALVSVDLISDSQEGAKWWHLLSEAAVAFAAVFFIFFLVRGSFRIKRELRGERENFTRFRVEAEKWRTESKKYVTGLSHSIDVQLNDWSLTVSEKEIAFFLLKGLSLKEIADIRKTSEKTVRAQSTSIYSKSGLSGRSQLSAFFLEDLLLPCNELK